MSDTIFALATGTGKSAVAIVRVSGSQRDLILRSLCGVRDWPRRQVVYTNIFDETGALIDKAIVIVFDRPRSFTGEDMAEFQITGGRGVKAAIFHALLSIPETRAAEAGEFARRAFENGKIDLAQVEGLAAIVDAETHAEVRHSALMAFGVLSREFDKARMELLQAASIVEGLLDFSDVDDPDNTALPSAFASLISARNILNDLKLKSRVTERLREGFTVALVGKPNVGKSTLVNYLLEREAALVSDIAGTTRDYLEFFLEIGGFPIVFVDTAGFRSTSDPLETMGIRKSKERVRAADLILWISDSRHLDDEFVPTDVETIRIRSKSDLNVPCSDPQIAISISAVTGEGMELLVAEIVQRAKLFFEDFSSPGLSSERQITAAVQAIGAIDRALSIPTGSEEMFAEDVRAALTAVGRMTGRVDVEDVLDEVFSRLCVGK